MRHKTRFDTHQPLIYHFCTALKPILFILCHITSYTTPSASFNSIKLHQHIAFRYSFKLNIVSMRHTTCFNTHQPLICHLCTALKPILCILCHITSYTTLSASFNFDQTSSTYCFLILLQTKHSQYEAHDLLQYILAPYILPLNSFKANIMHFMSYNFLYDPLSLFQFRSNFINILLLDMASK